MGRLHSIYDDVGNGIKEKVFVLRGDEAYARSTNTIVTVDSTFDESNVEYFTTDVSVEVLRSLGTAPVYLYRDDEQKIGEWNVTMSRHSFTLEDAQFEYGNDVKLYAKFMGNHECLYSKSKPITIHRDIPAIHKTNITITTNSQISHSDNCSVSVALKIGNSSTASALHNRDIRILVDGAYVKTITTGDNTNTASTTITDLTDGIHTITAEVDRASNINSGTASVTIMKGHKLLITDYPTKFIDGIDNSVSVLLTNYNDEPIPNATISFNSQSYTTNSDGVATCIVNHIEEGSHHATYQGSVSNDINVIVTYLDGIYITRTDNKPLIGVSGFDVPLLITVRGEAVSNIPVTISGEHIDSKTLITDSNGNVTYNYACGGYGDVDITASISNSSETITIEDCASYMNSALGKDNINLATTVTKWGTFTKFTSFYEFVKSGSNKTEWFIGWSYVDEDDDPKYSLEFKLSKDVVHNCKLQYSMSSIVSSGFTNLNTENWKKGATVKLIENDDVLEHYIDDELVQIATIVGKDPTSKMWVLGFSGERVGSFTFSELKFKRE